jgi:hypothetical protein
MEGYDSKMDAFIDKLEATGLPPEPCHIEGCNNAVDRDDQGRLLMCDFCEETTCIDHLTELHDPDSGPLPYWACPACMQKNGYAKFEKGRTP